MSLMGTHPVSPWTHREMSSCSLMSFFKVICLPSLSLVCVKWPGPGKDAVLVRQGCHSKYHRLGARNPHKLIVSQFWRLEAQDQGISRLGLQTPLFLACRCHSLAACLRGYPSRHNPDLSSSSWNISPIGLGPHPNGLILSPLEWPYLTVSSWMARILPSSSWAARF